ncbi:hypothetical protein DI005_18280 [Prauserella sp. PE36]|uniref:Uncharacterized protein n=1 Tax=Amycolatopsis marina TaxID=490629 RepID=A0A1I1BGX7_9PSEU|nr:MULTISPECIES: hypothetical protein [Pseudonocardiaceae]RBM18643.1 hypothetical protein DI005_18280 [Prauserella sp. PE36]SFB49397.1 hypothetical protein SAMN05216266_11427 [Amycolatopsis marina]
MTPILAILYVGAAVGIGAVVWGHTRGTWSAGKLSSHVARCVLLTVVAGAVWPAAVLVAVAYQFPADRAVDRLVFGRTTNGNA